MYSSSDEEGQLAALPTPALSSSSSFSRPPSRRPSVVSFQFSSEESSADERTKRRKAWRSPRRSRTSSLTTSPTLKSTLALPSLPLYPPDSPTFSDPVIFPAIVPLNDEAIVEEEEEPDYLTFYQSKTPRSSTPLPKLAPVLEGLSNKPYRTPRPKNLLPPHRRRSKYILANSQSGKKTSLSESDPLWKRLIRDYAPRRMEWVLKAFVLFWVSAVVLGMLVCGYAWNLVDDGWKLVTGYAKRREERLKKRAEVDGDKRPSLVILFPTLAFVLVYSTYRFAADLILNKRVKITSSTSSSSA